MVAATGPVEEALDDIDVPLCIDMDGTLLRTDALMEGIVRLFRKDIATLASLPVWLARGRATLKARVAEHAPLDVASLPYHAEFIQWLRAQHARGRRLVLCTAANERVARDVANHLGVFSEVIASTPELNLKGQAKATRLIERFGMRRFDYAGNGPDDRHCWTHARRAILVAPRGSGRLERTRASWERVFANDERPRARTWLRALRVHQWTKNALVLVPALVSHKIVELPALFSSLLAFLIFCCCASGGYLLNDLMDLDSDRQHARKRHRPFACGELPLVHGLVAAGVLLSASMVCAFALLGMLFGCVLAGYFATTFWYSRSLKRAPIVDVQVLAGLYTVRVIAGAAAIVVLPSFWLLAWSMFLFLSLAMAKRCSELVQQAGSGRAAAAGRGYTVQDLPLLQSSGIAAGLIAVLVLALYVREGADPLYSRPYLLWLLCPLLMYWICRIWLKTHRGQMHDDPIVFALTDRPSWFVFLSMGALCVAAL